MAVSKFEICSRALNTIGLTSIASFTEDNQRSQICSDTWDQFSRYLLSIYPWYFTKKKIQLGQDVIDPVNDWTYSYALPGDMTRLNAVYSSGSTSVSPLRDYELFGSKLFADVNAVWVDYQQHVETHGYPDWYAYFVIKAYALELAEQLSIDDTRVNKLEMKVWGAPQDNRRGGLFGFSMNLDSKQQPARPIDDGLLVYTRFV